MPGEQPPTAKEAAAAGLLGKPRPFAAFNERRINREFSLAITGNFSALNRELFCP